MHREETTAEGTPPWLITYSDLMTLLLVFFVLLFSYSEFRQTEKFQGVARSIHARFGPATSEERKTEELQAKLSENLRAVHERRAALTSAATRR